MTTTNPKTCLDCCQFSDDGPDGFCRLANHPAVIEYCRNAHNFIDADMSRCPGFVEDV
ncbi:hypothetical protein GFS31_41740 (plasmid) [Leptolyngbya sp. BL0902]|uniref:hypothetical protein n=1 Tax=Leptolyngbya sp. BL0902 TaxID=1115757 RepID=UPI0018E767AE|nr:hypothetical protein [Leptolyngbya sp. BL0902]QQE67461.1 hypothetical protein GFS31_41740 [Leptolyngbya sp. BL0902]